MPKFSKILYTFLLAIIILPLGGNCGIEAIGDRREGGHRGGLFFSCSDDVSTPGSPYPVICGFITASYPELFTAMGSNGQSFCTIRLSGNRILMKIPNSSEKSYTADALQQDFRMGLGGLIVGTDSWTNNRAFDLACPNCKEARYRLTVEEFGTATCSKCKIQYDLNNDGAILDKGNGTHSHPRGLYRYPNITYDGIRVDVRN